MSLNLIHFCSYNVGSRVYRELFGRLTSQGVERQKVFVPVRDRAHIGNNEVENSSVDYRYVKCLSVFTRVFYSLKLLLVVRQAGKLLGRSEDYGLVHAHTLYSDGIPAYFYARRGGKKLVITLRNTDVNLGFRFFRQYRWLARKALGYADRILFLSQGHRQRFLHEFGQTFAAKTAVIPNGIDDFFLENALPARKPVDGQHALYVGKIDRNKNLGRAIEAFARVHREHSWTFTVVGGSYDDFTACYAPLSDEILAHVKFKGVETDKSRLIQHYDAASIFVMPSLTETFGLVYLEAISRCVPVVYSRGQGIDGLFAEGEVGFACDPGSVDAIAQSIARTERQFDQGLGPFGDAHIIARFDWRVIASQYLEEVYR